MTRIGSVKSEKSVFFFYFDQNSIHSLSSLLILLMSSM